MLIVNGLNTSKTYTSKINRATPTYCFKISLMIYDRGFLRERMYEGPDRGWVTDVAPIGPLISHGTYLEDASDREATGLGVMGPISGVTPIEHHTVPRGVRPC